MYDVLEQLLNVVYKKNKNAKQQTHHDMAFKCWLIISNKQTFRWIYDLK